MRCGQVHLFPVALIGMTFPLPSWSVLDLLTLTHQNPFSSSNHRSLLCNAQSSLGRLIVLKPTHTKAASLNLVKVCAACGFLFLHSLNAFTGKGSLGTVGSRSTLAIPWAPFTSFLTLGSLVGSGGHFLHAWSELQPLPLSMKSPSSHFIPTQKIQ